jgi:hypothetical protein
MTAFVYVINIRAAKVAEQLRLASLAHSRAANIAFCLGRTHVRTSIHSSAM